MQEDWWCDGCDEKHYDYLKSNNLYCTVKKHNSEDYIR